MWHILRLCLKTYTEWKLVVICHCRVGNYTLSVYEASRFIPILPVSDLNSDWSKILQQGPEVPSTYQNMEPWNSETEQDHYVWYFRGALDRTTFKPVRHSLGVPKYRTLDPVLHSSQFIAVNKSHFSHTVWKVNERISYCLFCVDL